MKMVFTLALALVSVTLVQSSCAVVPRRTVFREADFNWSTGAGSGAVIGQATRLKEADDKKLTFYPNVAVSIVPANAYTDEIVHVTYDQGGNTLTPADSRYARYVRTTKTDGQGRFAFRNLPPGQYYVMATIRVYQAWADDNGEYSWRVTPIYARVAVRSGQTVQVVDWGG